MPSDLQSKPNPMGFSTRAIHHGYDPKDSEGALTPPLHLTSTFTFESAEQGGRMFSGEEPGHFYSRISNPTTDLLEKRNQSRPRSHVMAAYQASHEKFSGLIFLPVATAKGRQ